MRYVLTVQGWLDDHSSAWFEGLTITNGAKGEALLAGLIVDQAALHGLLAKMRDLVLPLVAVVPGGTPELDGTTNLESLDEPNQISNKPLNRTPCGRSTP